jgi:hypothetical protein
MKNIKEYISEALKIKSNANIVNKKLLETDFKSLKEILTIYSNDSAAYDAWERDFENGDTDCSWEDFDDMCWEDAQDEIKRMDKSELCAIVGEAEMWHGKKQIIPTEADTLMEAIKDCMGRHCEQLRLTILKDHSIKCEVGHHDGLNVFNIIGLNDKGAELFNEWAESDDDLDINFLYDHENRVKFDIL